MEMRYCWSPSSKRSLAVQQHRDRPIFLLERGEADVLRELLQGRMDLGVQAGVAACGLLAQAGSTFAAARSRRIDRIDGLLRRMLRLLRRLCQICGGLLKRGAHVTSARSMTVCRATVSPGDCAQAEKL